jgi:hypothetical protein
MAFRITLDSGIRERMKLWEAGASDMIRDE